MKWREPWLESMKAQAPFRPWGQRVIRGFVTWTIVLVVLVGIGAIGEDIAIATLLQRLWLAPVFGVVMSLLLYSVWWLSPRKIDSGPGGIVISKADELLLIPWSAISSHNFSRDSMHRTLRIAVRSGDEYALLLPLQAPLKEIEAELQQMTRG